MDQTPIQEIDIAQSLENTLAMFGSRLQYVEIVRNYEPNLPTISAYGSELNQVWTALIENAPGCHSRSRPDQARNPPCGGSAADGDMG